VVTGEGEAVDAVRAEPLRVIVVDDEALIRSGLAMILGSAPDIDVVTTCSGTEAMAAVRAHRPHVVLLDIRMPDIDGLTLLRRLRTLPDGPYVAMLTTFDTDEYIDQAISLGASGFLLKDTDPDILANSVRAVATGVGCLSTPVLRRLRDGRARGAGPGGGDSTAVDSLSARERQVLVHLGYGLSNVEIGVRMHLGAATVKDYVSAVLIKLGVANRIQAAVLAERAGLIESTDAP
jgi:DNA-binding NarL/FixJ family response regulator